MRGFEKIEYILQSFLGPPKNGTDTPQQQYNCPCCTRENGGVPDGKYNLEVNVQLGVYQCWKCADTHGTRGNLGSLIKKYGGNTLYKEYKQELNALIRAKLYSIENFSESLVKQAQKVEIKLPQTYKKINLNGYCKKSVREYLESRGIDQEIVDKFHLGYTELEPDKPDGQGRGWSYRIIIPSYGIDGKLNFYVGRDYTGNDKRVKYKNVKGVNKTEIIFQESLVDWDAPIYLCEGAIDCLFFPNSIAMLGKHLDREDYLCSQILKNANSDVVVCLDGDTKLTETKQIYSILDFGRLRGHVKYIRLGESPCLYKDFGEIYQKEGKKGMINAIKLAKKFTEADLIFEYRKDFKIRG